MLFTSGTTANPGLYVRQVADIVLEDDLEPLPDDEAVPPTIDTEGWADTFEAMVGFYADPRTDAPLHIWMHDGRARIQRGMGRDSSGVLVVPEEDDMFALWPGPDRMKAVMASDRPSHLVIDGVRFEYLGAHVTDVDPASYVGTYWSDELGTEYRIEPGEGEAALALVHRKQDTRQLRAAFEDGFWSGGDWLTFERDASGRVSGFTWSNGRVRKVRSVRRL